MVYPKLDVSVREWTELIALFFATLEIETVEDMSQGSSLRRIPSHSLRPFVIAIFYDFFYPH
jgi:hypothetical protein